jgi:hypothetical protein
MATPKPVRSPSYPSTPLRDAVEQVRKIEALYRTGAVDREAAAKLIGYSGLSGPANKALAALAQFGLVERAGKGEMRVTDRARAILYSDDMEERQQELRAAALEPALFRELQERWRDIIPPEDGVIMFLNRQGFNQSAVRPAARAYIETLLFLEEQGATESHGTQVDEATESGSMNTTTPSETPKPPLGHLKPTIAAAYANPGLKLNRVDMNIQGDRVHINGLLDLAGLEALEKKIQALKVLLESAAPTDTSDGSDDDPTN